MPETLSNFGSAVGSASGEERRHRETSTFLFNFQSGSGQVVVREPVERRVTACENLHPMAIHHLSTETRERNRVPNKGAGVPRTKILRSLPEQRYILLRKYEGIVTARRGDSFSARLFESSQDSRVVEAEFALEELSETDRDLVVKGAPLLWTIGYGYEGGTRRRESRIYLRRLPEWSGRELERGREAAEDLIRAIPWE